MAPQERIKTLREFYPYYLTEHSDLQCRRFHFLGTSIFFLVLFTMIFTGQWQWFWVLPVAGYGFAWLGHAFFEKNKPATFQYPLFSLASDFILYWHMLTGQIDKKLAEARAKYGLEPVQAQ